MKTKVREHPLLLSGEMVRAVLSGAKTQTRRPVKPQPPSDWSIPPVMLDEGYLNRFGCSKDDESIKCPWVVGDKLWVREAFDFVSGKIIDKKVSQRFHRILYKADGNPPATKWTPSIHMPRWASRLTLEITEIRVQRVQEISECDAQREGCQRQILSEGPVFDVGGMKLKTHPMTGYYRDTFRGLWNSTYGKGAWDANPWCWCLTFRRAEVLGE